eukprot:265928-Pyramimonas_sp.AAC.2
MLGDDLGATENATHPGGSMRFKAHDTMVLMGFALDKLRQCRNITHYHEMVRAGESMIDFLNILKGEGIKVSVDKLQRLFDLMQMHLVSAETAGIHFVPKHHFAVHLVQRTR